MLSQAVFTVALHVQRSLYVNSVRGRDRFRSHMVVMDVDIYLDRGAIAGA